MKCTPRKDFSKVEWRSRRRRSAVGRGVGSVQSKVRKLQKLIPGGQGLQPDLLLSRTAHYILHLRLKVNVLQALSKIYQP